MDIVYLVIVVGISVVVSMPVGYLLGFRESRQPVEFRIGKIALKKGDDLILHTHRVISDEVAQRLKAKVEERFPGHRCVVLGDGMKMDIISRA